MALTYEEAVQQISKEKPRDSYIFVEYNYNNHVILNFKDGVAFLNSLSTAEHLVDPYSGVPKITAIKKDVFTWRICSRELYENYKIAGLMNISLADVEQIKANKSNEDS